MTIRMTNRTGLPSLVAGVKRHAFAADVHQELRKVGRFITNFAESTVPAVLMWTSSTCSPSGGVFGFGLGGR